MDNEHKKMKQIMQMSKVRMPFDDFEQRIMGQITDLENAKSKAHSDKKYAIIFFLLGSICGILLNNYWMNKLERIEIMVAYRNYIAIISQIIFVVLICSFCHQLWKLIKIQRDKSYQ
ncbi:MULTISPECIES: hypothetical protein [Sphingobacterium]|uniref:Uncharacterized protein n=1 Tax=Sphingobacterium ginsenosidimutans TaxID=687845 RepID=A0ABP8A0G4_9SPHI|nr:hypothetical protein [Sphingobacterium sp. E70]ULT27480.1 hypothetical protein KUH03_12515 [Sphingobacterium sp. E70]